MEVIIQPSAAASAELVARVLAREIQSNPRPVLGLATGRTMEAVYARLVRMHRENGLDFSRCHSFNLDEYVGLCAKDPHSYRYYMDHCLFRRVNIDLRNTHLPDGAASDLEAESERYERLIKEMGGVDLQLLGIGHSGHIGFNEPLSALSSRTRVVTLSDVTIRQNAPLFGGPERMPRRAITMGVGTILDSRKCLLLATGKDKAEVVSQTIEGPVTSMVPATALQMHACCTLVLDEAAASRLQKANDYRHAYERDPKWDCFRKLPEKPAKEPRLEPAS